MNLNNKNEKKTIGEQIWIKKREKLGTSAFFLPFSLFCITYLHTMTFDDNATKNHIFKYQLVIF